MAMGQLFKTRKLNNAVLVYLFRKQVSAAAVDKATSYLLYGVVSMSAL